MSDTFDHESEAYDEILDGGIIVPFVENTDNQPICTVRVGNDTSIYIYKTLRFVGDF